MELDQDTINRMNENFRELSDILPSLSSGIGSLTKSINELVNKLNVSMASTAGAANSATAAINAQTKATQQETVASGALSKVKEAELKAAQAAETAQRNLSNALNKSEVAFKSLATSFLDGQTNFSKFNTGITGLGDAAADLAKNFGPVGQVVGLAIKGLTAVATAATKQADNALKAVDELNKFGTAGNLTTKEILDMAHASGLTSKNLDLLTKPIKSISTNIFLLGDNVGAGAKKFAELTAITSQQREQYQRLGVSQGELIQNQADYVALQAISGRNLKAELKDKNALQKASLEYTDNLLKLAEITGQDVESIKKRQQEASRAVEWQVSQIQAENKARRLEAEGRTEEAAKVRAEAKNKQEGLDALASMNQDLMKGAREFVATGTLTSDQAQGLARLGMVEDLQRYKEAIANGANAQEEAAKLNDIFNKKLLEHTDTIGFAASRSQAVGKAFLHTEENLAQASSKRDVNMEKEAKAAGDRIKQGKAGGVDPAQDARAKLTTAEINTAKALDKLLGAVNPLIGGFGFTTAAALGLAGALTFAAGKAAMGGGAGALGGILKNIPGVGGIMGGMGGAARGAGGMMSGAAGALGGAAKGLGGAAGGAIEGIGKLGGTVLTSVATGLKAFANPQVVLGAAGFGAAITAIGAGLAGASWVMGKALPTLAEGLTPFTKMDGDKLIATGKGIAALGGGLAVFGAGGVAASFGAVWSSVVDGLVGFFGGKTPFDRIVEFGKLDINADEVKKKAEAFAAFGNALSTYKGSDASVSKALQDNVVSFLGGGVTGSFDKFVEFSDLDIGDPGDVKKNAEAFTLFGNAMSTYKGGPDSSIAKTLQDTVVNFLGGGITGAFDSFVEFSDLDVGDPDAVKKKTEAFVAFGNAFAAYKGGPDKTIIGALKDTIVNFVSGGSAGTFEKFSYFAKLDIKDPENVKKKAEAFTAFGNALSTFKGGNQFSNIADNLVGGLNKLLGGESITDKFVKFTKLDVDPDRAGKLAEAFSKYVQAMSRVPAGVAAGAPAAPSGPAAAAPAAPRPAPPTAPPTPGRPPTAPPTPGVPGKPGELGGLSERYEAGKKGSSAVGWDSTGGTSFGKYQIATKTGTMNRFMDFLKTNNPEAHKRLSAAGPADGGKNGAFAEEWKKLAGEGKLGDAEHEFIKQTHFDVGVKGVKNKDLQGLLQNSKALQEVMWSTSVQHGGGGASSIFSKVYKPGMSEEELIRAIYAERGTKFGRSTPQVQESVKKRFADEQQQALGILAEGNKSKGETLKAQMGGFFSGSKEGFPVELHGTELVQPLDPNSLLKKLATTSESQVKQDENKTISATTSQSVQSMDDLLAMQKDFMDMMSEKLDSIISSLEQGNDTQDKLLQYSMT